MLRKGHSLVVEGKITMNELSDLEYCFAATEVLSKPEELAAAMERNNYILAQKLKVAEEEKLKVTAEDKLNVEDGDKLNVSEEKQNIEDEKQNVAVKEPEVMVDRYFLHCNSRVCSFLFCFVNVCFIHLICLLFSFELYQIIVLPRY